MKLESGFVSNEGTAIHYLDSIQQADHVLPPLLIAPGLGETAEDYVDLMECVLPRRTIVFSFRGRGLSDTPVSGYNLDDHVSDIEKVVGELHLERFHLFGFSRGASYALGYAVKHPDKLVSLIIQDYPAVHRGMPTGWADWFIENQMSPNEPSPRLRPEAVYGIEKESTTQHFELTFNCPLLIMQGLRDGSLLPETALDTYRTYSKTIIIPFSESSHDIRKSEYERFTVTIREFMAASDNDSRR